MPGVMYNLPFEGCLNNLFVNAGVGYGVEREKYTYDDSESKSGNNILAWNLGAGYNYFFTTYLALTPGIGYDSRSYNPADSENGERSIQSEHKYTEAGFVISFGLSYFFGGSSQSSR